MHSKNAKKLKWQGQKRVKRVADKNKNYAN